MDKSEKNNQDCQLGGLREKIDSVDTEILELLNRRASFSLEVGKIKEKSGGPIFRPGREQALLDKLGKANKGPLPEAHLSAIYREILSSSRALQRPLRVAFLGPEGTFSHMACLEYFGEGFVYVPKPHLPGIFAAVESDDCDLGIVPLENSIHGSVGETLDLFAAHEVFVQAEWISRICLSLMSKENSLAAVKTVYSHIQPLGQCAAWLRENLPAAEQISLESTAASAHRAAREPGSAAIGHTGLADKLGLSILATGIEDIADNRTRFFIIGSELVCEKNVNKSSIMFSIADKPGSLLAVLKIIAEAGMNMSKLESRPMHSERWKYIFFADLDCDITAPEYVQTIASMRSHCVKVRVLGAYHVGRHAHAF